MTSRAPSLTRDEARERTRLLHVTSYDVHLDLTCGDEVARSRVTVRFLSIEPGADSFAELTAERVHSATLNGVALPKGAWADGRIALTGLALDNTLVVDADIPYSRTGDGLNRYIDPEDGETYVGAYIGVVNAQKVFACFDQPDLKAEISTRVTAPPEWTVVGNGRVIVHDSASGTWELASTPRISPYLYAVVAGPLHAVHTEHRGLPMSLYARRSVATYLDHDADEIVEITRACYDRYADLFDEPYPFDKYDQVFVPGLNWGALEQVGCVLFQDDYIFTSSVTDEERLARANTMAHEMAHMWFGNLMTLHWWDDIWLNESFAEYMGAQITQEATRFRGAWEQFGSSRKPWGYAADERPSTHPVAPDEADVVDTDRALENFDGISYAKGASALRQLVAWLGDDAFAAGINGLITERRFGTATLDDLLRALTERSGRDVNAWADAWLRTSGHDTLQVVRDGATISIEHPGLRPHRISVGLYDRIGGHLVLREEVPLVLEPGVTTTPVPFVGAEPDAVLHCHRDLTFAAARHDARTDEALRERLASVASPLARVVVWTSWRDRVRHGEISAYEYLARVGRHLSAEGDAIIADAVLEHARGTVVERYVPLGERDVALALLREVSAALDARAQRDGSSSLRLVAVRGLIDSAGPDQVVRLQAWLRAGYADGLELDEALRWRILRRLAELGAVSPADLDAALAAAPTDSASLYAARARASCADADAKAHAWDLMTSVAGEASAASTPVVKAAASGFWQPGQGELLAAYVSLYLPAVEKVFAQRGAWVAHALTWNGFPWHDVDPAILAAAEAMAADTAQPSILRRYVGDAAYDYRLALTARTRWSR